MASLFFIMLTLFVLSFAGVQVTIEAGKVIEEIQDNVKGLDSTKIRYIKYSADQNLYLLQRQVSFRIGSADIPESDQAFLKQAGRELTAIIEKVCSDRKINLKYLVIIEGTASVTGDHNKPFNDRLSYARALAVKDFWDSTGVQFNSVTTQVMVVGSGFGGTFRSAREVDNQRIIIQIIPKFSNLNDQ